MKVKYSVVPFIPAFLAMMFLELMSLLGVDSKGEFMGMNSLNITYVVVGIAAGLFVICLLFNLLDRKTAPAYPVKKNGLAGLLSIVAGVAVIASSVSASSAAFSDMANSENLIITVVCAALSIPAGLALMMISKVHFTGKSTVSSISMLYVFPALWGCAKLVSEFLAATRESIYSSNFSPLRLFCYIFIALYLFSNSMVVSRIKGRNPVKGLFIYGLPMVALTLTAGAYEMVKMSREGFYRESVFDAVMLMSLGLYALSFILEVYGNTYTKETLEIVDSLPDEYEDDGSFSDVVMSNSRRDEDVDAASFVLENYDATLVAAPENVEEQPSPFINSSIDDLVFSDGGSRSNADVPYADNYRGNDTGMDDFIIGFSGYADNDVVKPDSDFTVGQEPEYPEDVENEERGSDRSRKKKEKEDRRAAKRREAERLAAEKREAERRAAEEREAEREAARKLEEEKRAARRQAEERKAAEKQRKAREKEAAAAQLQEEAPVVVIPASSTEQRNIQAVVSSEVNKKSVEDILNRNVQRNNRRSRPSSSANMERLSEELRRAAESRKNSEQAERNRFNSGLNLDAAKRAQNDTEETGMTSESKIAEEARVAEKARAIEEARRRATEKNNEEAVRRAGEERRAAEEAKKAEEARRVAEEARRIEEERRAAEEARRAEEARLAAEAARRAEEARLAREAAIKAEEARRLEEARRAEEARLAAEAARKAEEARRLEEARRAEEARLAAEAARKAEEARRIEEARRAEEARLAAEAARKAEEERRIQEAIRAEQEKKKAAQANPSPSNIGTREEIYRERRSAVDQLLKNLGNKK